MSSDRVAVFFYGLFMDASLLASMGVHPSRCSVGYVDGFSLRIGRRATLVPDPAGRAHGVVMTIKAGELRALYSEESVADYVPESVLVVMPDGKVESTVCYNLPENLITGTNPDYANALLSLAGELGFPDAYLHRIREHAA